MALTRYADSAIGDLASPSYDTIDRYTSLVILQVENGEEYNQELFRPFTDKIVCKDKHKPEGAKILQCQVGAFQIARRLGWAWGFHTAPLYRRLVHGKVGSWQHISLGDG